MKAIVIYEKGPAENLQIAQVSEPEPGPHEVRVRVTYAGVNHGDVIRRERGIFPVGATAPYILGLEGVGSVIDVGQAVKSIRVGQRVGFLVESGAYAQVVYVPEGQAFVIPEEIPDTVAGSSICVGLTAWHLLRVAALKPGQTVLVHGGAGGVGSTLVQMCKKRSAKVITTVGSDEKAAFAQAMGADCVIDYGREEFSEKVLDFTDGCGVEVIFDCVGRVVTDGNFACLQNGGQIVYFGSASGHAQFPGDKVLNKAARITGFVIFNMFRSQVLWQQGVNGLLTVLMDGSIATRVKELPMADVVAAHKMLESRQVSGKLVLDMR